MLDAPAGAFLRVVTVSRGPSQVTVDDRTGDVFVLSTGGALYGPGVVSVLDTRTGSLRRTTSVTNSFSWGGQLLVARNAGRVFLVPGYYGTKHIVMLDASSGALLDTLPFSGTPLVNERTNQLLLVSLASTNPVISYTPRVVNAVTGHPLRIINLGCCNPGTTFISQLAQTIFVGGTGDNKAENLLCVLDVRTGQVNP